ncbi:MAG: hypothetical protein K6E56_01845, partial [Lachnospiraceae bacterium]|nr:hypothetical protein [Lachnospiraceae bacterium]
MSENDVKVRKRKKPFPKRFVAVAMTLGLILGVIAVPKVTARAAFDPAKAIKYKDYRATHEIENSTLFIGTYLISLSALTDDLFAEADESASDSNQTTRYYYSELADGAWRNITDATGLKDLGPDSGVAATEEELAELYITKVIGSDGAVFDAKTGAMIGAFSDPDPYDLYHLPELAALRKAYAGEEDAEEPTLSQYLEMRGQRVVTNINDLAEPEDIYEEGDNTERSVEMDTYVYNAFHDFFANNVHNEYTDECDRRLSVLQELYNILMSQGDNEKAEVLYTLMGKIDSARRAEVFRQLTQDPDFLMAPLGDKLLEGTGYYSTSFVTSVAETDGYSSAEDAASTAYYDYLSNAFIEDNSTILGRFEYIYSMAVIDSSSIETLDALIDLYNIKDGMIVNRESEYSKIVDDFLPEADGLYTNAITSGVTEDYKNTYTSLGAVAAASYLVSQLNDTESARSELEFLIDAQRKRMEAADALDFIFDRIDWTIAKYDSIKDDNAKNNCTIVNDEHLQWLRDVVEQILAENESLRSSLQNLQSELNSLEEGKQECLDNNDLQGARRKEAEIGEIKKQINAETLKLNAIINSENASDREKEQARAAMGAGEDKIKDVLYNSGLAAIASGDTDKLSAAASGLAALGATDELNRLRDRLAGTGSGSKSGSGAESGSGSGSESGSGSGAGSGSGMGDGSGTGDGS